MVTLVPFCRTYTFCFFLLLPLAGLFGQGTTDPGLQPIVIHPKTYLCTRATEQIRIDGNPDEPVWKLARWTDDFSDIEGDKRPLPRFRTRVKMLWDEEYFYIAAEISEPHVWATLTKRDTVIFYDNDFEVFMDPDGDNFEYGEFEMNALNTVWDLFLPKPYKDGGHPDDNWNIDGMKTAVHVNGTLNDPSDTDSGWTAEIAFPWASLARCSHSTSAPPEGELWRVNFSRVEWMVDTINGSYRKISGRREDNWVWSPQNVVDMHRPEMWGIVQFTVHPVDSAQIIDDPSLPVRGMLMSVYYAQKMFFENHKRWAGSLNELDLKYPLIRTPICCPEMQLTPEGYIFTLSGSGKNGDIRKYSVRQDSYLSVR